MLNEEVKKAAFQRASLSSLYFFAKHVLNFPDINRDTHSDIIDCLESPVSRKLIVVPRGTLKSTIGCVAYPIWKLIQNPNERILIDSELYTNSKNFIREIRHHLTNPKMTSLFGEFKSDTWNESEIIIKQRSKGLKESSITAGGVGTIKVGQHYSIIICDDLNSNKNSATKEGCEKVINHYKYQISLLEPDGILILIATRYSDLDLIAHVLRNEIKIDENEAFRSSGMVLTG